MRVLVDNSVWTKARILVHVARFPDTISAQFGLQREWRGFRVENRKEGWIDDEIEWLPTVRSIFIERKAIPFVNLIADAESWRGAKFPDGGFGDLLADIRPIKIDWPFEIPSVLNEIQYFQFKLQNFATKEKITKKDWKLAARTLANWFFESRS